jgi:hypothetical protein
MHNASLQAISGNQRRMAAIFAGALLWLVLSVAGVVESTVPGGWRVAGVVAAFALFMAILVVGARTWAATPVRHELDEDGLRTFGPRGELRERTRWTEMREYLIEPIPRTSILLLRITRADGRQIRITEGRRSEQKQAFGAFCSHFASAVARQQAATPNAAIREGVSFYHKPGARALGVAMLVLSVVMIVASFFVPADGHSAVMQMRLMATVVGIAPFIQRTVFADRPVKRLPPPQPGNGGRREIPTRIGRRRFPRMG